MRSSLSSPLLTLLTGSALVIAACGGGDDGGGGGGGGGDGGAGGGDGGSGGGGDGGEVDPPVYGFQIRTPDIEIGGEQEVTYCYYTTLDLEAAAGIKKWSSVMTPGSHHLIVFFTGDAQADDGTLESGCGFFGGDLGSIPIWAYAAQTAEAEMAMPDGIGTQVEAQQHLYVQMHYLNASPDPITAHVTINGETFAPGVDYTPAAAFVSYSTDIDVDPHAAGSVEHTCSKPDGTFFTMSTHSHHFTTSTEIHDGADLVLESDDWEHPASTDWMDPPHYEFSDDLTYRCDYFNDTGTPVQDGDSAKSNEMCMAIGYFFPATEASFCINDLSL